MTLLHLAAAFARALQDAHALADARDHITRLAWQIDAMHARNDRLQHDRDQLRRLVDDLGRQLRDKEEFIRAAGAECGGAETMSEQGEMANVGIPKPWCVWCRTATNNLRRATADMNAESPCVEHSGLKNGRGEG